MARSVRSTCGRCSISPTANARTAHRRKFPGRAANVRQPAAISSPAKASGAEIKTPGAGGTEAPAAAVARTIVQAEIAELNGGLYPPGLDVLCDGGTCFGFQLPTRVAVRVTIPIYDIFFDDVTAEFTGADQLLLKPVATANYVGN